MDVSSTVNQMNQLAASNNVWSAQQAQKQMDFQKMMSDTAHQREVADLKAAGLNPVLSAGGNGAASASGAMGETDQSVSGALGSILQTVLSSENAKAIAEMNNSAALLRQQESDKAAMERLLTQFELKNGVSSSSGIYSSNKDIESSLDGEFNSIGDIADAYFENLPDKGYTYVGGTRVDNKTLKLIYSVYKAKQAVIDKALDKYGKTVYNSTGTGIQHTHLEGTGISSLLNDLGIKISVPGTGRAVEGTIVKLLKKFKTKD